MKAGIRNPIVTMNCGEQARAFLRTRLMAAPNPCVVFLDIKMAGENGFDVLAWARQQHALSQTAIYIMSRSDEPADKMRASQLGATGYLVKHPKPEVLAKCVKSACGSS